MTTLSPQSARRLAPTVRRLQRVDADALARLRDLERPSDDDAAIERFLEPAGRLVDALGDAGQALAQGDTGAALLVLQRSQSVAQEAEAAARDYGFTRCGALVSGTP